MIELAENYVVKYSVKEELKSILKGMGFKLEYVTKLNPFPEDKRHLIVIFYKKNGNGIEEYTVCGYNSDTKEFCNVNSGLALHQALKKAVMWMQNQV